MPKLPTAPRTFVWDLDGTTIDSLGILEAGLSEVLPKYGRELPEHMVMLKNFHGSLEDSIHGALGGGLDAEELMAIVQDFLSVQDKEYEIIEPHIFPDALRLGKRAHAAGYWQMLVTNRAHEGRLRASPRNIVANSDLSLYIDAVVCGDDGAHHKPIPEVLGAYESRLKGSEVTVIGDQFVDAEFAYNIGANAILVCRDGAELQHMDRLGPDWRDYVRIVSSLDEVEV